MATLTKQTITESGADLTLAAATAGGDQFTNTGKEILVIQNGDVAGKTVTITAQQTSAIVSGLEIVTKNNQSVTIAAGGVGVIGPFNTHSFNDSNKAVQITYSAVTSLKVAVISN